MNALLPLTVDEMEAFAKAHGIPALLDQLGLDGLAHDVVALSARAEQLQLELDGCENEKALAVAEARGEAKARREAFASLVDVEDERDALSARVERLTEALEEAADRLERIFDSRDPEAMTQEAWFGLADARTALGGAAVVGEGDAQEREDFRLDTGRQHPDEPRLGDEA